MNRNHGILKAFSSWDQKSCRNFWVLDYSKLTQFSLLLSQMQQLVSLAWAIRAYGSLRASQDIPSILHLLLNPHPCPSFFSMSWRVLLSPLGHPGVGQYGAQRRHSKIKMLLCFVLWIGMQRETKMLFCEEKQSIVKILQSFRILNREN